MAEARTCPNCGAALPRLLAHARMVDCGFCGSSVMLEDAALRVAGEAGTMLDAPELIGLGRAVELGDEGVFTATGHLRYDYGRGHWDEYHGALLGGALLWVAVDEGDVAVQTALPRERWPRGAAFRLGAQAEVGGERFTVDEVENATLTAFRGQLPEPVAVGDVHLYANFSGERGMILSGERWAGGEAWFLGRWVDPFRVRPA
ncbi:DUF4178 domain-containing protein [Jannaschia sp. W003]|uniref:DUF4178 domain-containing protein n=1 Tax=Jannaschia sp. W003 TaxID=2867012 RepID=UPI0021A4B8BF|nr:DUF4178 domain-containing protein [Jannaschia sp. W003]UWQ20772.1 DUF4178 domain-containing protein [Jannaschia sp. W003]